MCGILVLALCIVSLVFAYRDGTNGVENRAGKFALVFSALFPIVGIIIYFVQRNNVLDAGKYAKWAGIGFLVGLISNFLLAI